MPWAVNYHPDVQGDLDSAGRGGARRILKVVEERIQNGSPDKSGRPLRHNLAGCRRIRTASFRIIYKVDDDKVEVLVLAVGPRRNKKEAYTKAEKRT